MYSGIQKIESVLSYIEENITSDIDCKILSQKMNLSVYEFRRIFAFIIGCPISEYIRKRRLTLAACEIMQQEKTDLLKISEKYRYTSQSAFTKAFKEFHGFAPSMCQMHKQSIKLFTVPVLEFRISERSDISFRIIDEGSFYVCGYSGISEITDSCCCESIWNTFYEKEYDKRIVSDKLIAVYKNNDENVVCTVGFVNNTELPDFDCTKVSKSKWACFTINTTDDNDVNKFYNKILYSLLPSANLRKNNSLPIVEVYPFDMSNDGFEWEIRIPIETEKE